MKSEMEKIFTAVSAKKADLITLILTSQNIESQVEKNRRLFDIKVNRNDIEESCRLVDTYYRENKFFRIQQEIENFPLSSFISPACFIIMGLLVFVHILCLYYDIHEKMIIKYGASALFIFQGETYRGITALFLHADAGHLAGNLAGLLIFAAPVITVSGYGTGSFMLLFTGALGNLINAHIYRTAHLSIGASTAVMGAAGLLAAFQVTRLQGPVRVNTLMPILAGATLMAMFSQGENTDIMAHVLGFLSGVCSGILFFPFNRFVQSYLKDPTAIIITGIILLSSLLAAD